MSVDTQEPNVETTTLVDAAGVNVASVSAAGAVKMDGSAVTQPISAASLPLPSGAATAAGITTLDTDLGIINANLTNGNATVKQTGTWTVQPGNTPNTTAWLANPNDSNLSVTATGAAAAAVTLTLPAVAAQFHRISFIEITAYTTVARVGAATPVLVTSTNLPGSNVWTFATAAAIGSTDVRTLTFHNPYKSSVVNTATTIVCPATASVIWRVNVMYYTAA